MIKQSFISIAVLLLSAQFLSAATTVERDHHFWSIKRLIDRELRLVVDPEVESFKKQSYPGGDNYASILRLHYCQIFQLDDPSLATEIEALSKSVAKTNNPDIDALISTEVTNGGVLRYVNPLLRDLLPDSPAKELGAEKKARVEKRVKLLTEKATVAMAEFRKRIDAHKGDEEKYDLGELDENEGNKVIQKAVGLRLDYANECYFTYLALREVLYRGDQFGIDTTDAENFMVNLIGTNEQIEELGTWDWNYADYQIFLRHRIQVMQSDVVRRGHKYGDYGQVVAGFQDVLDTPLDGYPGSVRPHIENLKLTALADLLYWHVAMDKARDELIAKDKAAAAAAPKNRRRGFEKKRPEYAAEGIKLFEHYKNEMKLDDMLRKDKALTNKVAQAYFVAGRLYRLTSQVPKALDLIAEIMDIKPNHYYYGNARRWKSYFVKPPEKGEIDFHAPMTLVDPEKVLDSIADILSEARGTEDKKQRRKMYTGAAISLRNAVLSLQDPEHRRKWVKVGPTAYYQYAYVLYKLEKYEHAAIASMEGALAYKSLYERRQKNPFKDDKGKPNANMDGLQKLVQNLSPYTSQLRRVDKSEATTQLYRDGLKLLDDVYKEIVKAPNPKAVVISGIQEGDLAGALEKLEEYATTKDLAPSDQIWAARIRSYIYYLMWDESSKGGDKAKTAELGTKLDASIKTVDEVLAKHKDAKDVAEEAGKAVQMVVSIEVGKAFRTGDYLKVLLALDEDFWANPPEEGSILQKLAGQMCGASYKYHVILLKEKDPQKTLEMWPHIKRAYMALMLAREKTGAKLSNSGKALAETYKNIGKLADWFVETKSQAGAKEFNFAQMNKIVQQAPLQYGNIMMDVVLGNNDNLPLVRSVARTLQRGGDNERAALLYEQYLTALAEDTELMTFRTDSKDIVDRVGDVIMAAPLGSIRKSWVRIRDLLVDKPGFVAGEYRQYGGTTRELSEEKVDYAEAVVLLDALLRDAKGRKAALGADYEKVMTAVTGLREKASELATYIQIMDFTVQAYLDTNAMDKALPYIKTLIDFDPAHPRYRALNVEIVLRAVKGDNPPPKNEIIEARKITIDLLKQYKDKPSKLAAFWLAYCQAYELTAVLGEIDNINKSLKRHHNSDITPIVFDLAISNGDGTHAAKDQEAAALIKRYLGLYDVKGVTFPKPFELSVDDDQLIIKMVKE